MIPIYRSDGEWVAVYVNGFLFNIDGEWLGFAVGREVYDSNGMYLGFLSNDKRLLRKRAMITRPRFEPPAQPERPEIPPFMPLAPMLAALPHQIIDMFEEHPERLIYVSETKPDME